MKGLIVNGRSEVKREQPYKETSAWHGRPQRMFFQVYLMASLLSRSLRKHIIRQEWRPTAGGGLECYWLPGQSPEEIDAMKTQRVEGTLVTRSASTGQIMPYKIGDNWQLNYTCFVPEGEDEDRWFAQAGHPRPTVNTELVIQSAKLISAKMVKSRGGASDEDILTEIELELGDNKPATPAVVKEDIHAGALD